MKANIKRYGITTLFLFLFVGIVHAGLFDDKGEPFRLEGDFLIEGVAADSPITLEANVEGTLYKTVTADGSGTYVVTVGGSDGNSVTLNVCGIEESSFTLEGFKTEAHDIDFTKKADGTTGCTCSDVCSGGFCNSGVCASSSSSSSSSSSGGGGGSSSGGGSTTSLTAECADGEDNDNDGLTDLDDPDCTNSNDDSESGSVGVISASGSGSTVDPNQAPVIENVSKVEDGVGVSGVNGAAASGELDADGNLITGAAVGDGVFSTLSNNPWKSALGVLLVLVVGFLLYKFAFKKK